MVINRLLVGLVDEALDPTLRHPVLDEGLQSDAASQPAKGVLAVVGG